MADPGMEIHVQKAMDALAISRRHPGTVAELTKMQEAIDSLAAAFHLLLIARRAEGSPEQ